MTTEIWVLMFSVNFIFFYLGMLVGCIFKLKKIDFDAQSAYNKGQIDAWHNAALMLQKKNTSPIIQEVRRVK